MTVHFVRRCGQLIVALSLLAFLMPRVSATERIAPSMSELLDESNVIVAGVMPEDGPNAYTIEVAAYLRGRGPRRIETEIYHHSAVGDRAFRFDQPGVFFLKRNGDTFAPVAWKSFHDDRSYVETMLHIDRDPGPFLSSPRWRSNEDVIDLLGARFSSYKVTSADAPDLARWVAGERIDPFPWSMRDRREITLTTQAESPYVKGDGTKAGEVLAAVLSHHWRNWTRPAAPARFTLVFDTRRPPRWGSIGPGAAIGVFDEVLRSRDSWLQSDALWAASRMRAEETVPAAIALLKHERQEDVRAAISFLSRSRSPLAVRALTSLVDGGADPLTRVKAAAALECIDGGKAPLTLHCYD